jgi:molybdenum cofactor cytidylyltransferase
VVAVLLAAGESTRMGDLKALLDWDDQPLIAYQAAQLLATTVERTIVVLGHRAGEVAARLPHHPRVETVSNEDYRSGKVSSIVAGVRAAPVESHVLVLGVDQPRPASLVQRVIDAHLASTAPITVAGSGGRRGHPVLFAPALRPDLLSITEETQGLRAVLQRYRDRVVVCDTGSPLALVNLNTPEDYAAARALAAQL